MDKFNFKPKENTKKNDSLVAGALIADTSHGDDSFMSEVGAKYIGSNPILESLEEKKRIREILKKERQKRLDKLEKNNLRRFSKEVKRLLSNGSVSLVVLSTQKMQKFINKDKLLRCIEDSLDSLSDYIDKIGVTLNKEDIRARIKELEKLGVSSEKLSKIEEKLSVM